MHECVDVGLEDMVVVSRGCGQLEADKQPDEQQKQSCCRLSKRVRKNGNFLKPIVCVLAVALKPLEMHFGSSSSEQTDKKKSLFVSVTRLCVFPGDQ